ncbi:MAG: hypothetical protein KA072_03245 [Thermoanaerobaculaceae bacterium]|nr:hypothetical protein [Thermoanaerobaculaceae bacterium]MDI9620898.1 hypothetical protein [Acidobacteriota bacterium]NLH10168.1 hypothetical protein [Holophagae bacterium]HPW54766.1 hypothetical protein [Thermoanaerobaculaceae bacterium]
MSEQCTSIRRSLEEHGDRLDPQLAAHLSSCPTCQAHAVLLGGLESLAPAPADEARVLEIMAALPPAPWLRRRAWTWAPVAAAGVMVAVGVGLVGGVPAPSVMETLPEAAGGLLGWMGNYAVDALVAARSGSGALQLVAAAGGMSLVIASVITLFGGGWAMLSLVRRGRSDR